MSQQVRLDSAEGFFAALRSPDVVVRLSVLQAVAKSPRLALAFGKLHGQDVVDELIHQAYQKQGYTYLAVLVETLGAFDDPRVTTYFKKLLTTWDRPEMLSMVVGRLSREPLTEVESTALTLLKQERSPAHIRAAADLLLRSGNLDDAQRIRVTVANSRQMDLGVPCDYATVDAWMRELHGPFASDARVVLESRGEAAFETLLARWSGLTPDDKVWMLAWARMVPVAAFGALRLGLEDSRDVRLAALRAVGDIEGAAAAFRDRLVALAESEDDEIRFAAIQAGAPVDAEAELARAETPEQILAIVNRATSAPVLAGLLEHDHWSVRAAAARALVRLGEPAREACRPLVSHPRPEVRVGATSVLFQLEDVEWLEERLIAA
jgi:HEAT repeat protein